MSLKTVCGRSGSGKTRFMLNDMKNYPDSVYIVPEQFSFSAEKKIIADFGVSGLGNPVVMSFHRIAQTIIEKFGGGREIISGKAAREMLVSFCAGMIPPEKMRLFEGLVRKNAIAPTASELITTFKRYNITEEQLMCAAQLTDDEVLKKKLDDAALILGSYNNKLREYGVDDPEDILSIASSILKQSSCTFFDGKCVYIDQFSDFDPQQYAFIGEILKKANRVCIGLCMDDDDIFLPTRRTHDRLIKLAQTVGITVEPPEYSGEAMKSASPMLRHLEKCCFAPTDSPFAGSDGRMRIFCGKNMTAEIHAAARRIVALVRDCGYRYREISVVARDIEEYKSLVERIFPLYNIPVFLDRKIPLSGHCVTLYITGILDIIIGGYTYENVFRYIKSPFSPLNAHEADMLENYCLACGVRPYMWKKPFRFKQNANVLDEINELRARVYEPLSVLTQKLHGEMTVHDICAELSDFFEQNTLEDKISSYAALLSEDGENLHAMQTMQIYNMLSEILSSLCAVMGNEKMDLRSFSTTVNAGLGAVEIGTIPSASDCVTVGSIDRIKGHGSRAVFLVGVNSGKLPSAVTESGLFSDKDRQALLCMGIELPPGSGERAQSEQLLVYDALTCADRRLQISYPIADNLGSSMLPSEIVSRILLLFPDIEYDENITGETFDRSVITTRTAVFEMLSSKLRSAAGGEQLPEVLCAAGAYFSKDVHFAALLKNAIDAAGYTNEPEKINDALMRFINGNDLKTSISRLEAYNKCPFSYFVKYVLKLRPREIFDVGTADSGSFLHELLDKFSQKIASSKDESGAPLSWSSIDEKFIRENIRELLCESIESLNENMLEIPRIKALLDRLLRVAEKSVFAVRNHIVKGDFIPLGYEISFDEDGRFKPLKITLEDGKNVTLRGRIDRADVLEDTDTGKRFVRIVDYKSSDHDLVLSDVYHGLQLQLFVYLSNLCENDYSPAGILYCNLTDPIIEVGYNADSAEIQKKHSEQRRMSGLILSEENMRERMGGDETLKGKKQATYKNFNSMFRHLKKEIAHSAEQIYDGKFPMERTANACDWCDCAAVCRFDSSFAGCRVKCFDKMKDDEIWQRTEAEEHEMD